MIYSEFQKVATKAGMKMIGESGVTGQNAKFRIVGINTFIVDHQCRVCWQFARRWIDKDAEHGKYKVSYTIEVNGGSSSVGYWGLCDYVFKYTKPTEEMKALLVKKPGAGNFKKGSKKDKAITKPLTPAQKIAESQAAARWEVDLEI